MVQASINNERDSYKVADVLIMQHPRIHLRESRKRAKGKGEDGIKPCDNLNIRRLQEKGKHTSNGKLRTCAYYAKFTFDEDYGYNDDKVEIADAYQAHNDPGSEAGEEAPPELRGRQGRRHVFSIYYPG